MKQKNPKPAIPDAQSDIDVDMLKGNSPTEPETPLRIERFVSDDIVGISVLKPVKPIERQ